MTHVKGVAMPNYLSLFSGIGGLDLGLDRAGWTCVGQVEIDPFCRTVLQRHWPEVARHDDVWTCVEWWLGEPRPAVDMVVGGFPCQPVSVAGKRRAQADDRWLWPAAWAVIRDLRPQWAVLENVPGLLSRGMGDVLGDLAAIGYDAEWDCVPAAALGAPHLRYRVFVVAYPDGEPGRVQPVAESRRGGTAVARDHGSPWDVADPAGARLQAGACTPSRTARDEAWRSGPDGLGDDVADPSGDGRQPRRPRDAAEEPRGRQPLFAAGPSPHEAGWPPVRRRDDWLTEPDVGRVAYGVPARVDRLRALGNAVVPQVAEHIGRMILDPAVRSHV